MMRLILTISVLLIAGCASAPRVMVLQPEIAGPSREVSWPSPEQVPRIDYEGQLLGEQNFVRVEPESGGRRFLDWLTGLGRGEASPDQLVRPQTGIVDSAGRVLVTDGGSPSVFVFDEAGGRYEIWREAMPGVDFLSPVGIAELPTGGFIVADADFGALFLLSREGRPLGRFKPEGLERPTGIDVDRDNGDVYVADTSASLVRVYTADGKAARIIGEPGDGPGQLNAPMHIRLSGERLFVSDALNAHVQIYDKRDGRRLGEIGRRGLFVGNFVRPKGVALDSDSNIYIVESYYDHLLIYNEAGEFLLPIGGTGNEIGRFFLPAGVWTDGHDRIFVADMFNARVVIFRYVGGDA